MTPTPRRTWSDPEPEDEVLAALFRPLAGSRVEAECPSPELLQAAQMGALPAELQTRVASHVDRCAVCQTLREALDDPDAGRLTPEERQGVLARIHVGLARSARLSGGRNWRPWLAAAAALATISIGAMLYRQSAIAPTAPAVSQFRLDKPALVPPPAGDLLWRGGGAADELTAALEPFRANNFGEASRRLKAVVDRHPQSAYAHFYLGVSDLFVGENAAAAGVLENAERLAGDDTRLAREIAWYLALAYRRTGRTDRAADKLNGLCRTSDPAAARACAALAELSPRSSPASR